MNWERAKWTLIACFLALDVFLGWQVLRFRSAPASPPLGRLAIEAAVADLERAGITLSTSLPRTTTPVPFWRLRSERTDPEEAVARWLSGAEGAEESVASSGSRAWSKDGQRLTLWADGRLVWEVTDSPASDRDSAQPVTAEQARRLAIVFLSDRGALTDGAYPASVRRADETDDAWIVRFQAGDIGRLKNFAAWAEVLVKQGTVVRVERSWPLPVGPDGTPKSILPSTDAVRRVAQTLDGEPAEILAVELGYYSAPYDAESWLAPPVWRVRLGTGQELYINAYTGHFEAGAR